MKIAILPGDGIGPEIVTEAVKVLQALELPLELEWADVGGKAYETSGHPLPEGTFHVHVRGEDFSDAPLETVSGSVKVPAGNTKLCWPLVFHCWFHLCS